MRTHLQFKVKRRRGIRIVAAVLIGVSTVSCQSSQKNQFAKALNGGHCEKALFELPENQKSIQFLRQTEVAAGTALSYTATGVGYTADAVLIVAGGAVIFTILCGPLLLASMAGGAPGGENGTLNCLPAPGLKKVSLPHMGKNTYKETAKWRCPELQPLSQSIESVASCYSKRGDDVSLKKALTTLESLAQSDGFYECLPKEDRFRITAQIFEFRKSLALIK